MTITKILKAWLKQNEWPTSPVRLGPGACGQNGCRTQHAYVEAVGRPDMFEGETMYVFLYDRPCNAHERVWDPPQRRKVGLK